MSGATAERTFRPSATTSGPMPSPGITARRITRNPRSAAVEVGRTGLPRADPAGDLVEQLAAHRAVDGDRHQRLSPTRRPADLRTGDVDRGLAERRAHRADDPRPVDVGEEQQMAGRLEVDL